MKNLNRISHYVLKLNNQNQNQNGEYVKNIVSGGDNSIILLNGISSPLLRRSNEQSKLIMELVMKCSNLKNQLELELESQKQVVEVEVDVQEIDP